MKNVHLAVLIAAICTVAVRLTAQSTAITIVLTGQSMIRSDLRATKPVDPDQPVMVAGDPQWNNAATRMRDGIPVGAGLLNQIRQIAQASAAPWLLD